MAASVLPNTQPKDFLAHAGDETSYKSSVYSLSAKMATQPGTHSDGLVKPWCNHLSELQLK